MRPPGLTKVALMSVEMPVLYQPLDATASEPTESTSVMIRPPWSVPARFTALAARPTILLADRKLALDTAGTRFEHRKIRRVVRIMPANVEPG